MFKTIPVHVLAFLPVLDKFSYCPFVINTVLLENYTFDLL